MVSQKGPAGPNGKDKIFSQEESQEIAEEFLRNSPTFVFDGMEETLELVDTLTARCPSCWAFIFEFDSRHAGYGDRTGQTLAQVITPHRAVIGVEQGKLNSAVMDEKWDMLEQQEISPSETETADEVHVDDSHSGEEVNVDAGNLLIVTLESNPTTGFTWRLAEITDEAVLEQVSQNFEPPGAGAPVGAGGKEVWTFKALEKGESTISMEYQRPWEEDTPPAKTFVLTVMVE